MISDLGSSPSSPSPSSSSARRSPPYGVPSSAPPLSPTPTTPPATPSSSSTPNVSPPPSLAPTSPPPTAGSTSASASAPDSAPPSSPPPAPPSSSSSRSSAEVASPSSTPSLLPARFNSSLASLTSIAIIVIQDYPSDYIIVAVSLRDGAHTQIYDSRSRRWKELVPSQVDWWGRNAVYLDGLLFCLSSHPNRLLKFDPVGGQWSTLDVHLPIPFFGRHLLGFGGELYLTGVLGVDMVVTRIGIWKLHWSEMAWKEFDFMPERYLAVFDACCLTITACAGMICFSTRDPKEIVMCDLAVRRWWCPKPYNMLGKRGLAIGSAIEPHINLLM